MATIRRMLPVESEMVTALGYDADTRTLRVKYRTNFSIYDYANVTPDQFVWLVNNASIGVYIRTTFVKNPDKYPATKVKP